MARRASSFESFDVLRRPLADNVERSNVTSSSKRSASFEDLSSDERADAKRSKRARRVRWADGIDYGCDGEAHTTSVPRGRLESLIPPAPKAALVQPRPATRRHGDTTHHEDADLASRNAVLECGSGGVTGVRVAHDANGIAGAVSSAYEHIRAVSEVFRKACADFERAKRDITAAIKDGAPVSVIDRLDKRATVLDALHRRAFENAFLLNAQARPWPMYLYERVTLLAAIIHYNRAVRPGDLGVSPSFALHALRCARWSLVTNANGAACILPTSPLPLRLTLWDHENAL